jgi:hypothetical protein
MSGGTARASKSQAGKAKSTFGTRELRDYPSRYHAAKMSYKLLAAKRVPEKDCHPASPGGR